MDIQPEKMSLLGLASKISSGDLDVKELLGTEDWSKKERFALWMFGKKFGSTEESKLRQCVEKLKQVLPEIAQQDWPGVARAGRGAGTAWDAGRKGAQDFRSGLARSTSFKQVNGVQRAVPLSPLLQCSFGVSQNRGAHPFKRLG